MSTIDPSTLDPTKPTTGEATTASVRANELATQTQLQNAKNDIEALEPHPGRTDNPHAVTAAQTGATEEAPNDGQQYARQSLGWSVVTPPVQDHGSLLGLADDDHTQYHTDARGDARYAPLTHVGAAGAGVHANATGALSGFLSAGDKSKLDGIAPGAQPGDMTKAEYDPDDNGIVEHSRTVAGEGTNNSGATITKGTFVQVAVGPTISPAEPQSGMWAVAAADEDIPNTASGRGIIQGLISDVDTSGGATGDLMYLDVGGGYTLTQPTDKDYQVVGVLWQIDPVNGSFEVRIADPVIVNVEGATGVLVPTDVASPFTHANLSLTTWTEVIPGAGDTTAVQLANMAAGANPGRLAFDYSGTAGPSPNPGGINGSVTIHLAVEFTAQSTFLDVGIGLNGAILSAELSSTMAIGANQTVGTTIPVTLTVPLGGLSDGNELSIMTRGSVDNFIIHALEVAFFTIGGAGGGGGGGTNNHNELLNRNIADQHVTAAITGLDAALASKAEQASLDAHTGASTGAHAASAISVVPTGGLAATDVQGGLVELDSDLAAHVGAGGAEHAVATGVANGFLSSTDKTKLDGIADGAAATFTGLSDTPANYSGQSGKFTAVTIGETGLEFVDPPGGSGDVVGPASAVSGNLASYDGTTGKLIADSNIASADVALQSASNIFTEDQIISQSGDSTIRVSSVSGSGGLDVIGSGSANTRRFRFDSESDAMHIYAETDAGVVVRELIHVDHAGGGHFGNPTGLAPATPGFMNFEGLLINNAPAIDVGQTQQVGEVGYPATSTAEAGATINPTMAGNGYYHSTLTGALTIDITGDSVDGQYSVFIPATVTGVTITGTLALEIGSSGGSVAQMFTLLRTGGNNIGFWAKA